MGKDVKDMSREELEEEFKRISKLLGGSGLGEVEDVGLQARIKLKKRNAEGEVVEEREVPL